MKEDYQQLGFTKSYENDLNNEIKLLKIFSYYENSLKYYGNYDNKDEKIIILEKCDKDLKKYMEKYIKNNNKSLNVEEIKKIFNGLNIVFKEMYKQNIIHRDLKLKNLLVKYKDNNEQNFIVKIGDYGIGKFLNESDSITGLKGSRETVAPEILLKKVSKYENLVDIFSLGVIIYQLSHNLNIPDDNLTKDAQASPDPAPTLAHPFDKDDVQRILIYCNKYEEDNFEIEFNKSIENEAFKDLVIRMLKLNPKNRLTWEQYFNHPFFN